jgi:hypothetical protein
LYCFFQEEENNKKFFVSSPFPPGEREIENKARKDESLAAAAAVIHWQTTNTERLTDLSLSPKSASIQYNNMHMYALYRIPLPNNNRETRLVFLSFSVLCMYMFFFLLLLLLLPSLPYIPKDNISQAS